MDLPRRKKLPHEMPLWIDPQREVYFLTVNCQPRGMNHLAKPDIAGPLLESVRFRNEGFIWFAHVSAYAGSRSCLDFIPAVGTHGAGNGDILETLDGKATGHQVAAGFL
jgi:hypothetical protein